MRNSTNSGRRWRFALLITVLSLVLAACGSSGSGTSGSPGIFAQSSRAPSAQATANPSEEASEEPTEEPTEEASEEPTEEPTERPTAVATAPASALPSEEAEQLAKAATKLADLTSYRLALRMEGTGFGLTDASGTLSMKATVVLKPERAMEFEISGLSMGGTGDDQAMTFVIIGDQAWMIIGGTAMEVPEGSADSYDDMFESLAPNKLFGSQYGAYTSGMEKIGPEQKNGVATVHYRANEATLEELAKGVGGSDMPFDVTNWKMDVWVAVDGGYLVSALQEGVIKSGETSGPYLLEINISNINDPANQVKKPK